MNADKMLVECGVAEQEKEAFLLGYKAASENSGECCYYPGTKSERAFNEGFCKWLEDNSATSK